MLFDFLDPQQTCNLCDTFEDRTCFFPADANSSEEGVAGSDHGSVRRDVVHQRTDRARDWA